MSAGARVCARNGCNEVIASDNPRARYHSDTCRKASYDRATASRSRDRHRRIGDRLPIFERPFLAFDGEGEKTPKGDILTLLACSDGRAIHRRTGLGTEECLRFLVESDLGTNRIWYGGGWDATMMLVDLPLEGPKGSIRQLYETTRTTWKGWKIHYVPRKFLDVSRRVGKKTYRFRSYDVLGFFQSTFIAACEGWAVPVPAIIERGKKARGSFDTWKMKDVIAYNAAECEMLVELMNRFREAVRAAGWTVSSWHGAGALASTWLGKEDVARVLVHPSEDVADAAGRAYFGGRVEVSAWGEIPRVHHYDINSAYPAMMRDCIDLSRVRWVRKGRRSAVPDDDFALVHISFRVPEPKEGEPFWGPFPWRGSAGNILFPPSGEGWYFAREVRAAIARFGSDLRYTVIESYSPKGTILYPVREGIERDYHYRAQLKAKGDPANVPIKLALNSLYGRLAMRATHGGKRSRHYSLLWAGFITSGCRALISDGLALCDNNAVLAMTDGLWTREKIALPVSVKLGDWTYEKDDVSLRVLQAGVYEITRKDGTTEPFTRGFERGSRIDFDSIIRMWEGEDVRPQTTFEINRFVGMGLALTFPEVFRPHYRSFTQIERTLAPVPVIGTTKREGEPWRTDYEQHAPHFLMPRHAPKGELSHPYKGILDQNAEGDVAIARLDRIASGDAADFREGFE